VVCIFRNFPIGKVWLLGPRYFSKIPEREILVASFFKLADNFPHGKQGQ